MKVMFVQSNSKSTDIFTNNLAFGTFKKHSKFFWRRYKSDRYVNGNKFVYREVCTINKGRVTGNTQNQTERHNR